MRDIEHRTIKSIATLLNKALLNGTKDFEGTYKEVTDKANVIMKEAVRKIATPRVKVVTEDVDVALNWRIEIQNKKGDKRIAITVESLWKIVGNDDKYRLCRVPVREQDINLHASVKICGWTYTLKTNRKWNMRQIFKKAWIDPKYCKDMIDKEEYKQIMHEYVGAGHKDVKIEHNMNTQEALNKFNKAYKEFEEQERRNLAGHHIVAENPNFKAENLKRGHIVIGELRSEADAEQFLKSHEEIWKDNKNIGL